MYTCTGYGVHLYMLLCKLVQVTVYTCTGYCVHLYMLLSKLVQVTMYTCTGYFVHLYRLLCTLAHVTVYTCTGYCKKIEKEKREKKGKIASTCPFGNDRNAQYISLLSCKSRAFIFQFQIVYLHCGYQATPAPRGGHHTYRS